jgi:hypothetical protein
MRSRLEPMKKVARMLRVHEPLLLNWFRAKGEISAGAVEGLNNKIRVMTRRSYGFRTFGHGSCALSHAWSPPRARINPQILLRRPNKERVILRIKDRRIVVKGAIQHFQDAKPARHLSHIADKFVTRLNPFRSILVPDPEAGYRLVRTGKRFVGFGAKEVQEVAHPSLPSSSEADE